VTRKCRFGGRYGVCGFVLEYYPLGSLADHLSDAANNATAPVTLEQRFRWSKQVTEALIHINSQPYGFYPDLKPDNIVLREGSPAEARQLDIVLLDLEQRGGWFSWSPPEIAYVEYLEILASRLEEGGLGEEITAQLEIHMPGWKPPGQDDRYRNSDGGFSAPWLALVRKSKFGGRLGCLLEKAQVFMLGKLLWCIFECQPRVRCGIDHELLRDNNPDLSASPVFPEFRSTPTAMRTLIRDCTLGAPEWDGRQRGVVLRGGRLVPANWVGGDPTAEQTQEAAKKWWATEVKHAREFMLELVDAGGTENQCSEENLLSQVTMRPLLSDVFIELGQLGTLLLM
jgi:hypothetical protein